MMMMTKNNDEKKKKGNGKCLVLFVAMKRISFISMTVVVGERRGMR
jgi:hypothetical protein